MEELYSKYSQKELLESVDIVTKHIESEAKIILDTKRIFIGGFS